MVVTKRDVLKNINPLFKLDSNEKPQLIVKIAFIFVKSNVLFIIQISNNMSFI